MDIHRKAISLWKEIVPHLLADLNVDSESYDDTTKSNKTLSEISSIESDRDRIKSLRIKIRNDEVADTEESEISELERQIELKHMRIKFKNEALLKEEQTKTEE